MPRQKPLYAWIDQVVDAFPNLSRPQATVLALYSFGMILARRCGLNRVAIALVPLLGRTFAAVRSWLQEFYQEADAKSGTSRRALDITTCFAPLLDWVLKGWPSMRIALALDATSLGDRFVVLSLSVVYRGSALPVAWKILLANVPHPWQPEWIALLRAFQPHLPVGWTVVVMTDRGLYARWLFQEIVALGWHPLMRITQMSKFRTAGSGANLSVKALVPKPGRRWQGRGTAFPSKPWRRLECTLLACWEPGHEGPWFLVTDLGPEQAEGLWYGMRSWIEHGFKLLKSAGWQWQATRMTDCARAERLWLALAVATRYVLAVGGDFEVAHEVPVETIPAMVPPAAQAGTARNTKGGDHRADRSRSQSPRPKSEPPAPKRRASGTKQRVVSVFLQGLSALAAVLIAGHALPRPQWKPEPWLELRGQITTSVGQPPTPIPKNPSL
ncbi:MAG: transposase [Solirubrobacterales bacterium]|nr:transposase [Solirubrobacterales bacterium]